MLFCVFVFDSCFQYLATFLCLVAIEVISKEYVYIFRFKAICLEVQTQLFKETQEDFYLICVRFGIRRFYLAKIPYYGLNVLVVDVPLVEL